MNNITVDMTNLTEQEREQLTGLLAKAKEPSIMECTGGGYALNTTNQIVEGALSDNHRIVGNEYTTSQEAQRAAKMRTEREILNNIIRQENKRTGYVADWNDNKQEKYEIYWCANSCNYEISWTIICQRIGVEYCNVQSAKIIVAALNTGRIQGMDVLS